jgi:hypothetical protein
MPSTRALNGPSTKQDSKLAATTCRDAGMLGNKNAFEAHHLVSSLEDQASAAAYHPQVVASTNILTGL